MAETTFEELKEEYKLISSGDAWGEAKEMHFVIAEDLYFNRSGVQLPPEWQFRPSPLGMTTEDDSYQKEMVELVGTADLLKFGKLIYRYLRYLKFKGLDQ